MCARKQHTEDLTSRLEKLEVSTWVWVEDKAVAGRWNEGGARSRRWSREKM